ncbi:MAG: biosynthetic-type acetolactate synthase large subunit [Muribaculaceae bacterium]|nr:biosynthetic-type acetolactate synthase large subunit [Muribaculaceae bacterium]
MSQKIKGAEALIKALIEEGVTTIFGYPGGAIIPVFDCLYDYREKLNHILVRHEQGATHAAQGYSRISGKTGVVIATSGPGATNLITGISDAMMDSTPLVVITGQISSAFLGTDAFQETDVIGITQPVTKWSYQIRNAEDIPWAVARAFYIASSGRPGPVVLDFAKNAQVGEMKWSYKKCNYIRSYIPVPEIDKAEIVKVAEMINNSSRPMIAAGHGIMLSEAEEELLKLAEKADIPVTNTLLGLSTIPSDHYLYKGMLGMHGNIGANYHTLDCDLFIAIGMRFDDRVTGDAKQYVAQAKVIHIDIDESEFDKNVKTTASIHGDAKMVIKALIPLIEKKSHTEWLDSFKSCDEVETEKVIKPEIYPESEDIHMGEVVNKISEATGHNAVLVTDVGQNQMLSARYFKFNHTKSIITSGGLGTMGFGLPAAIGAKFGAPERTICYFTGDGGIQMTIEELGVILQYGIDIKIIILNNNFLGMVRQWQELFFNQKYSQTPLVNPNFKMIANAYGIKAEDVESREELDGAIERMLNNKGSYLLNIKVEEKGMVFPMIPAGHTINELMLNSTEKYIKQ